MWIYLMAVGFIGYLTSLVLFIIHGIRPDGSLHKGPALRFACLALVTFALWLIALARA